MEFLRGVRSKVFDANIQLEKEPTVLFGVFLTPAAVGTQGIVNCYDGWGTDAQKIASFSASYDFGTSLKFPIQFAHACYITKDSDITDFTVLWLTNEQAVAMFHNEMELEKWHREAKAHTSHDALRQLGII